MAQRTSEALVGGIIELDVDIPIQPFIDLGSMFTDEVEAADIAAAAAADPVRPVTLAAGRLEMIERYLSAHGYATRDPRAESEGVKGITQKNQSKVDLGFNNTHYGQMAMRLDTTGYLAQLNATSLATAPMQPARRVGVHWAGTDDYPPEGI